MKKILLTFAAIFIATQLFSQDAEKITITYKYGDIFNGSGYINALSLLDKQPLAINVGPEYSTRIIDIKNMQVTFYSDVVDTVVLDIVKYEKLDNGMIHIVSDERNTLFPEEENVRIFTHTYVDVKNNLSVYSWTWLKDGLTETYAGRAVNPKIEVQ